MSAPSTATTLHSSRRTTLADGLLVDATQGDLAGISREHFPDRHLTMTSAVFALLERAAETDESADFAGLWHDILSRSRTFPVRLLPGGYTFELGTSTSVDLRLRELKIIFHGGDHGEPCATIMLPEED